MKKIAVIVVSAMLGSAFTMGLFRFVDQEKEQIVRIEHVDHLPTVASRYRYAIKKLSHKLRRVDGVEVSCG